MSSQFRIATVRPTLASAMLRLSALVSLLGIFLCGAASQAQTTTTVQTTTTLAITAKGAAVTTAVEGTAVTLSATVLTSANVPVAAGTVNFCKAAAKSCADVNLIGTAQLTAQAPATLTFIPPPGAHSYQAVFVGADMQTGNNATDDAPSTSTAENLDVTAATTTTITQSGALGDYTLTATVSGAGAAGVPTGMVSFLDTSNSDAVVATATLGSGKTGALAWTGSQTPALTASTTALTPQSVAVGDFNGDGIPDLAVGAAGYVCILLGKGDGTFEAANCVAALANNQLIAVGNFVPGGPQDLIVANNSSASANNAQVFIGDGKGGITAQAAFNPGVQSITGLAVGDLQHNGTDGFVFAGTAFGIPALNVYVNGDNFSNGGTLNPFNGSTGSVVVGDVNGDGISDLIDVGTAGITVFLGNGLGNFSPAAGDATTIADATSIVAGDFNSDGNLDVAVTNGDAGTVVVYLGDGKGGYTAGPSVSVGTSPVASAVGDFNGDGIADIAVITAGTTGNVVILLGADDGVFTAAPNPVNGGASPVGLVAANFNSLDTSDLAVVNSGVDTATIQLSEITSTATATATGVAVAGSGAHLVDASYPGDANYAASVSATTSLNAQTVNTSLSLGANPSSATAGQSVTLTATLTPYTSGGNTTDNQTITFLSGTTTLGTGKLSSGVATLKVTSLAVGNDSLTAKYAGDTNFSASNSSAVIVDISQAPTAATPTFSVPAGTYTSAQTVTLSDTTSGATIYYTTNGTAPTTGSAVYSTPLTVSSAETIEAVAGGTGFTTSAVATAVYTINQPTAATPTFSVPAGTYTSAQTVTISDTTSGAKIYYTINGTTPSATSTPYTAPITISATQSIEAIAVATGYNNSAVATAAYTINLPVAATPAFSVPAGTYSAAQTVTITDATSGAAIYYTTNGSAPSTNSIPYTAPITVSSSETLSAIATASGYTTSAQATAAYVINGAPVISATLSPSSLTFSSENTGSTSTAQSVTLTNTGTAALSITSITASANFAETNTCGSSVAVGVSCAISVTFTPTSTGALTGTLSVADNASGSPQTVALSGTGSGSGSTSPVTFNPETGSLTINSPGGSATDTIQLSAAQGFSGSVNLTCAVNYTGTGTPANPPTCTLNPAQLTVSPGSPATTTLTVSTSGPSASAAAITSDASQANLAAPLLPTGALALAGCFAMLLFPKRRRLSALPAALLVLGFACVAVGCSGGYSSKTTKGTYQVVVTAASSSGSATTTIPVTVQ
jgi:Bacterial Ig-like domain (group 3)/Chitobiase/beta-hexosaminidase C-terminal domain/FG-GAP-like repeat/Abnormal spindle-like microcephaly-assoc'd, ASPM-SPD-2-Hydin/FG-GAP repeat